MPLLISSYVSISSYNGIDRKVSGYDDALIIVLKVYYASQTWYLNFVQFIFCYHLLIAHSKAAIHYVLAIIAVFLLYIAMQKCYRNGNTSSNTIRWHFAFTQCLTMISFDQLKHCKQVESFMILIAQLMFSQSIQL